MLTEPYGLKQEPNAGDQRRPPPQQRMERQCRATTIPKREWSKPSQIDTPGKRQSRHISLNRRAKIKTVTMYEAEDGKQFSTEAMCVEYEQSCADLSAANDMLENGATLMAALTRAHQTRTWWDSGISLEDKVVLMNITKDTGFVVRHWQCSDKPGYKPCGLNHNIKVKLWGDVGCWSGPYGDWVSLTDLLRYARNTVLYK